MGEYIRESQDGFSHIASAVITGKPHGENESNESYACRMNVYRFKAQSGSTVSKVHE